MKALRASFWLFCAAVAVPLDAATIIVDTETDPAVSNPGTCSLRQAIQASNTHAVVGDCNAGSGADQIQINLKQIYLSRPGADEDNNLTGDLDISSNIEILGSGTTIDGGSLDRIFDVHSGELILSDLILTAGNVNSTAAPAGGAIRVNPKAVLHLTHVEILGNAASVGGAIFVDKDASMLAYASTIHGNIALPSAGGANVSGNGGLGGAIFTRGLNATLRNVTLTDNLATNGGGALYAVGFPQIVKSGPSVTLNNVTISANRSSNEHGSGIGGGIATHGHPLAYVTNSILVDNQADQYPDCSGSLVALRFNLLPQKLGCDVSGVQDGNAVYNHVGLAPLSNYGGKVPTMHPRYLSLARNARANTDPTDAPCENFDARGLPRPAQGACDFGAVEVQESFVITSSADESDANPGDGTCAAADGQCTLRAAIEELRAQFFALSPSQQVTDTQIPTLHIPVGEYDLILGQLTLDFPLLLIGDSSRDVVVKQAAGSALSLPSTRVLYVAVPPQFASDSDLNFKPPVILLEFDIAKGVTFLNPIIGGDEGGGIFAYRRNLLLYGMELSGNIAQAGGGLFAWLLDQQTALIDHSTFHDNFGSVFPPGQGGGAFFHGGSVYVVNSTFARNTSYVGGAGVYVNGPGRVSFSNTTIADNTLVATLMLPVQYGGAGLRVEPNTGAQVTVLNSVLGNNHDIVFPPDCFGDPISAAYSLIQAGNCFVLPNSGQGMIYSVDPLLAATLARNGIAPNDGLPQTLPPQPGSPLRNSGPAYGCVPLGLTLTGIPLATDEAENPRPQGARCDIGAFEAAP